MSSDPWEPWLSTLEDAVASGDGPQVDGQLEDLWRFAFHEERGERHAQWDRLFGALLRLLGGGHRRLRESALHYALVAMREEYGPPYEGHSQGDRVRSVERRTAELLPALEQGVRDGTFLLLRLTDEMVHVEDLADASPQPQFRAWLERVSDSPATTLAATIAYCDGRIDWESDGLSLLGCLDHADDLVRAYAARALGRRAEADTPALPRLVAMLTEKEIERPGIAGPFFSNWYSGWGGEDFARDAGVDVEEWICTILARRKGPEPDTLPCSNGIDFFAHEIFGGRPEFVRRLIDLGHHELAVETATEVDERIDGMEPLLVELAGHTDDTIARAAAWHLASHYRTLAPGVEERGFACRRVAGGTELFVNLARQERGELYAYSAMLYPTAGATFDAEQAAASVDALLPESLRGERVRFGMPGDDQPGLYRLPGRSAGLRYANGALINLRGDVDAELWDAIQILWHGRPGEWRPESLSQPG